MYPMISRSGLATPAPILSPPMLLAGQASWQSCKKSQMSHEVTEPKLQLRSALDRVCVLLLVVRTGIVVIVMVGISWIYGMCRLISRV